MRKVILVKTDDPLKRKFNLVVTGPVEKIMDIQPASVYLDGKPGDTLSTVVTITPSDKYGFTILGMEQKMNKGIQTTLVEPKGAEQSWQIEINSTSDKADTLYDVLILKTDSQYLPVMTIRVYAIFQQQPAPAS